MQLFLQRKFKSNASLRQLRMKLGARAAESNQSGLEMKSELIWNADYNISLLYISPTVSSSHLRILGSVLECFFLKCILGIIINFVHELEPSVFINDRKYIFKQSSSSFGTDDSTRRVSCWSSCRSAPTVSHTCKWDCYTYNHWPK